MRPNSFDCLAQLPKQDGGQGKRHRKRRGKGDPSTFGSDTGEPIPETDSDSAGSGPAALGTLPVGDGLLRQSSDVLGSPSLVEELHWQSSDILSSQPLGADLPRQSSEGCLEQAMGPAAGGRPLRSKSDLSSLSQLLQEGHTASLEDILEAPQPSQGSQARMQQAQQAAAPLRPRSSVSEVLFQPFSDYLNAELHPGPSYPTADVVWGQTERDRVYNAILAVPYQLERFLWFGMLVCLDSFLAVFTLLPVRFAYAVFTAARDCLAARFAVHRRHAADAPAPQQPQHPVQERRKRSQRRRQQQQQELEPANSRLHRSTEGPPDGSSGTVASSSGGGNCAAGDRVRPRLRGDQLYDLLGVLIFLGTVLFLWHLNAGVLYFWMKDLTQEFLKLSVLFTALELADKICCSFGVDVLEALAASCTQFMASPSWASKEAANLASDVAVAALLVILHGVALIAQAMVFGVAMNSKKNALVALLIAANFTEIKGTVLKRFDSSKLYVLACQDVVERFHLLITLAFVVVEEMGSSGHTMPNRAILVQCCQIFFSEAVIDVIKHAVLGKFNEIRPGVYREFMKDLCEKVSGAQSHNIHKVVGFEPFAPTALAFRIAVTYLALRHESYSNATPWQMCQAAATAAAWWVGLFAAKLLLGYVLKQVSASYVRHYESRRASLKAAGARRVTISGLAATPMPKKDE